MSGPGLHYWYASEVIFPLLVQVLSVQSWRPKSLHPIEESNCMAFLTRCRPLNPRSRVFGSLVSRIAIVFYGDGFC